MEVADDTPAVEGVRHEWVDAAGLRTHVAVAGPSDAPPVLLVHGWPQSWWAWRGLIPELAKRHRVFAPDLRGHGWTDAPPAGYEKEQLAGDLLALLDALGIDRVTWVGHDWGAWCGFLAALRAPERIERMVCACVPHPWTSRGDPRRALLLAYQGPISLPLLGPLIAPAMVRSMLRVGRRERLAPSDVEVFAGHLPRHVTVAMYRTFLTREVGPLLRGRYAGARLEVPTVLLTGARDVVTGGLRPGPVAGQPQLDVEVVDGVGHWVPEDAPGAILAALGD